MSSFNFIFWRFGSVCLLNEVRCNLVIFGNKSHHRDQYGHITMEGMRRSFSKWLCYTQELVLMGGQYECKRQIQFTAAMLKSNCSLAINVHPIRPCSLLFFISSSNGLLALKCKANKTIFLCTAHGRYSPSLKKQTGCHNGDNDMDIWYVQAPIQTGELYGGP